MKSKAKILESVRETYAKVAQGGCGCGAGNCCEAPSAGRMSSHLGYSMDEIGEVPDGANMGLGCGNPQAIAALQTGETVLDLGSGGGFDVFLAARKVGREGFVIGVDMTPEMIAKARNHAEQFELQNVDFRLGEIEHLPVADETVDVIMSNCVINLSPDKAAVFGDAFRVLRKGGRLAISDVVNVTPMPEEFAEDIAVLTGCAAGAASVQEIEALLQQSGFTDIEIRIKEASREFIREWFPGKGLERYVVSAYINAIKP